MNTEIENRLNAIDRVFKQFYYLIVEIETLKIKEDLYWQRFIKYCNTPSITFKL